MLDYSVLICGQCQQQVRASHVGTLHACLNIDVPLGDIRSAKAICFGIMTAAAVRQPITRGLLLAESKRAFEVAFPERAEEYLHALEQHLGHWDGESETKSHTQRWDDRARERLFRGAHIERQLLGYWRSREGFESHISEMTIARLVTLESYIRRTSPVRLPLLRYPIYPWIIRELRKRGVETGD